MQIHELNKFSGAPGNTNFLAIDDGTDTGKISGTDLLAPVNARIDNIVSGVTVDSEVIDGRLGADGVTYGSLGAAIRTQVSNIVDDVNLLKNAVDGSSRLTLNWEQGNLNASGEQVNSKVIRTTDYYRAADYESITPDITGDYVVTFVIYSGNTNPATEFIDYIVAEDGVPIVPDGSYRYFRIKMQKTASVAIVPSEGDDLLVRAKSYAPVEEIHTDAVGPMVEVAETYFNVAYDPSDQIVYQSQRGMYSERTTTDGGLKAMPCSQFVTACYSGTPYNYSRYVGTRNESYWWGLYTDGTGDYAYEDYMASPDMAQYCQDKGWLHTFDLAHNDMKPGDVAFYSSDSQISNVGHCVIVLAVGKNRYTFMEASANNTRLVDGNDVAPVCITTAYTNKMPTFYAHIPVVPSEYKTTLLFKDETQYSQTISSGTVNIKTYPLIANLEKGFYTFACDYTGNGYPYIKVTYEDGQSKNYSRDETSTNRYSVTFYAQMPIKTVEVRGYGAATHTVSNVTLRKGFFIY